MSVLIQPSSDLRAFVRDIWILEHSYNSAYSTLPDGCPGIVIQLPTALLDRSGAEIPESFVYGQTINQRSFHTIRGTRTLGIVLEPGGLRALFDVDAYLLRDDCMDLSILLPAESNQLLERLLAEGRSSGQISIVEDFLRSILRKRRVYEEWKVLHRAFALISESAGSINVSKLRQELGISERSLERRFRQWVGISPRLYARIIRFQSGLSLMRSGLLDFTQLAHERQYADQSHFIRDFKEFAGTTPARFRNTFRETVPNFLESRLQDFPVGSSK